MSDRRRRATPRSALLPEAIRSPGAAGTEGQPCPLRGAIYLQTSEGEAVRFVDRVLIGRAPHCQVVVLDPLVSREHAVIHVTDQEVVIEDLHSSNGVYVNNVRIFEPQTLNEGDRILVGTNEMAVFAAATRRPARAGAGGARAQQNPRRVVPGSSTERADALEMLGRLADRMIAEGHAADAEQVLADHLRRLLGAARSDLPLPVPVCANATLYALRLATALRDGHWINYAVELQLRAKQPFAAAAVTALQEAVTVARDVDHALFSYYVEWLRDALPDLPPGTRQVFEALERLRLG